MPTEIGGEFSRMRVFFRGGCASDRVSLRRVRDKTRRMATRGEGAFRRRLPRVEDRTEMSRSAVGAFNSWCARERSVRAATQA